MPDHAARAVIQRYWGDSLPIETQATTVMAPIERYMQFRRLNDRGWTRIIQAHGPEGARAYREAMLALGREIGLEM